MVSINIPNKKKKIDLPIVEQNVIENTETIYYIPDEYYVKIRPLANLQLNLGYQGKNYSIYRITGLAMSQIHYVSVYSVHSFNNEDYKKLYLNYIIGLGFDVKVFNNLFTFFEITLENNFEKSTFCCRSVEESKQNSFKGIKARLRYYL